MISHQITETTVKSSTLNFKNAPARPLEDFDLKFLRVWLGDSSELSDSELMDHVLESHNRIRASDAHIYSCVSSLSYLCPRARLHPMYSEVVASAVAMGPAFKILDVGSCMGQETRALIVDGVSPQSITTSDVHDAFWKAGNDIFIDDGSRKDAPYSTAGVTEIWGDWTTPLKIRFVAHLKDSFTAILCKNVHHALSKQQCEFFHARLFRVMAKGGVLFGTAVGRVSARLWARNPENTENRFLHSDISLKESLLRAGFTDVIVTSSVNKDDYENKLGTDPRGNLEIMKDRRYLVFTARK